MNISDSLDQYADICRDAIKKSSAKLNKGNYIEFDPE